MRQGEVVLDAGLMIVSPLGRVSVVDRILVVLAINLVATVCAHRLMSPDFFHLGEYRGCEKGAEQGGT